MLKRISLILLLILQCSCSINSNFGNYIIADAENRGRGEQVQVYNDREIFNFRSTYLGNVESNFCHEKNDSLIPEDAYYYNPSNIKDTLQDSLKVKAHKMGGNGIVFLNVILRQIHISAINQCVVKALFIILKINCEL